MMEDSAVTYVAQVPGRHSMRMATSGVAVLAEFLDKLEGVGRLDRTMGSIKQRARGVTAGEVLVGLVTDPKVPIGVRGRPSTSVSNASAARWSSTQLLVRWILMGCPSWQGASVGR